MAEPPPIGGIEIEDALQELLAEETNRQPLNRSLVDDTCCAYGDAPDEGVAGSEAAGPAAAAGSVGAVTAELEQLSALEMLEAVVDLPTVQLALEALITSEQQQQQLECVPATSSSGSLSAAEVEAAVKREGLTLVPSAASKTGYQVTRTHCWMHGTYFAAAMRDLMATLHRALDEEVLEAALRAACSINVLGRNAYNARHISSELGPGCEVFLNPHGTLKPDGSNHPWLEKISRVAAPFATSGETVVLSLSDALPVSQSWASFRDPVDEGSRVAKLYAERCTDDVKESQVSVR